MGVKYVGTFPLDRSVAYIILKLLCILEHTFVLSALLSERFLGEVIAERIGSKSMVVACSQN